MCVRVRVRARLRVCVRARTRVLSVYSRICKLQDQFGGVKKTK